ncbi:MAG: Rieske (2Fe-2S) iron-sulfur domain protein [Betaproteobacteria bacterium]|nr:Rieske (2Fe-2S) iron-sulfur domain protein [Betaproteobacteria bacterium]
MIIDKRERALDIHELDYFSPEIFEKEITKIFHGSWYAIGFASDLPNHNDFFLEHVGHKEVLVQNVNGEIRAFTNVCPHRFSAIHTEPRGNRALVCPYHLWSFNAEGVARFPGTADAGCPPSSGGSPRLEAWRVATAGNVIYVCLNPSAPSLEDYLGPSRQWIEEISLGCGYEFKSFQSEIQANWKVIINNTLEFYHAYSVHPQTFRPLINAPLQKIKALPSIPPNIHYAMPLKEGDATMARLDKLFGRLLKQPAGIEMDAYEHLYSFPNLTIGHVNARSFSFFQYEPVSPERTKLKVRVWMPSAVAENSSSIKVICEDFEVKLRPFIFDIAEEDRVTCEAVQRGLKSKPKQWASRFIEDEALVVRFQKDYVRLMNS